MNLAEILTYTDIGHLSKIANTYECECSLHSKNDLIQSILQTLYDRERFEEQVRALPLHALRFINLLLFDNREMFSLEDLIARVQQSNYEETSKGSMFNQLMTSVAARTQTRKAVTPVDLGAEVPKRKPKGQGGRTKRKPSNAANAKPELDIPEGTPRTLILHFKHHGWLFNGFNDTNRYLFQVPTDIKKRLRESLKRKFSDQLYYIDDEPEVYRDEQELLATDIKQLLTFIYQNEIPLGSEGAMYKRSVQQLGQKLAVKEALPGKEWRFGYGRHIREYPNRMSFLYDYCLKREWISESEGLLVLTISGESRQKGEALEPLDELYHFWLKLYKNAIPNLRSLVHWLDQLAMRWVTFDSLCEALAPLIKPFYYDEPRTILEQRIVGMLVHLGLMRVGEHPEHGVVVRMTPLSGPIIAGMDEG